MGVTGQASDRGREVVVTGLGIVSPLGNDARSTWAALIAGYCAVKSFGELRSERDERHDEPLRARYAEAREAGKRGEHAASLLTYLKLARALRVDLGDLLREEERP